MNFFVFVLLLFCFAADSTLAADPAPTVRPAAAAAVATNTAQNLPVISLISTKPVGSEARVTCDVTLMPAAGAGGLNLSSPLQRQFRDIHAASAHIALTWDVHAAAYGQSALGLEPQAGLLL